MPGRAPHSANPILPGYYADPSILESEGRYYIYATLDPWGGETLGCWESRDFKTWTYRELNWPTKQACTSPLSQNAMVWAPSVVRGRDGKYYMYVSVGSEIWAGTANHPLGPWRNVLGKVPLIPANYKPGFHMIDAEAFIDDDGEAYLYWGSGLNWKNGRCWAVRLGPDMVTFHGVVKDVTPANYFEAPFMFKHAGRYHLMYSSGRTTGESYRVHDAIGNNPLGPFTEASSSPILVTDPANNVVSPGHHAVFTKDDHSYILYHRHSIPFDPGFIGRQTCVDLLRFTSDGMIEKVVPTHLGPRLAQGRSSGRRNQAEGATATASSQSGIATAPGCVLDDNYATRWAAAEDARNVWLQIDLGAERKFTRQELRFEYAWKAFRFAIDISNDGRQWQTFFRCHEEIPTGSPVLIQTRQTSARYLRLVFAEHVKGADTSLFEWAVY